jgi:peroxiredoxin
MERPAPTSSDIMAPDDPTTRGTPVAPEPLQPQIDEQMDALTPDELRPVIDDLVARLRSDGEVPGLEVGATAPDFTLPDARGHDVTLSQRLAGGPVVLSFDRGSWCPVCNLELRALQASLPALSARGASLVAITPQAPDASVSFADQLSLGFDVLSDLAQEVALAYELRFRLTDELEQRYRSWGLVLPEQNADGSWCLPVPATFVLDGDGVVRARHVDPDYRRRMEPADVLEVLDLLGEGGVR